MTSLFSAGTVQLNPEQEVAVNADGGFYAVNAGPGSGKTTVLVSRYQRLVASGVDPTNMLCLTFSKTAAEELRKRTGEPEQTVRGSGIRTFHSFCLAFVTAERLRFPFKVETDPLITPVQRSQFLGDACKKYGSNYKRLDEKISEWQRGVIYPHTAMEQTANSGENYKLAQGYMHYHQLCRGAGLMDFAMTVIETANLLRKQPLIRAAWQFQHIMVDESQDADALQWELVKLLSEAHRNVFAVGDAGQAVYQWRSAMPELFLNFRDLFPGATTLYLGKNHRSTKQIVKFCKVIGPVRELAEKFYTDNDEGTFPLIEAVSSDVEEATRIADEIKASGLFPPEGFAVLARTNRQLVPIQMALADNEIPYKLLGAEDYWKQPEVKAVLSYAQLTQYPSDAAVLGALASPFELTRYLKKKETAAYLRDHKGRMMDALLEFNGEANQQRVITAFLGFVRATTNAVRGLSANGAINTVMDRLRVFEHYYEQDDLALLDNRPIENLMELKSIASRYPTLRDFLDYVHRLQAASRKRKGVALSTVHGAKGKEWPCVFLIGANEGVLPHKNGELDEESRIFFVACSRAAQKLRISYYDQPSRFLEPFLPHGQAKVS